MATIVPGKNKDKPYTVRFRDNGRQKERSFVTKKEAADFKAKFEYESREQIFVDPKANAVKFRDAADKWARRRRGRTQSIYLDMLRLHINPVFGERSVHKVSIDRQGVWDFLNETLPAKGQGRSQSQKAYNIIRGVINEEIKAGRLTKHLLTGIELPPAEPRDEFVFPTRAQLEAMAAQMGYLGNLIWLMRGCGLRIGEALGVRWDDFSKGTLRVQRQCDANGNYVPLKARKEGDYRDVPVPAYVLAKIQPYDSVGQIFPRRNRKTVGDSFRRARDAAGIEGHFTPHSLRHVFASVSLSNGIPITDVSHWLGHKDINTTFSIYGHLVPSSFAKATIILDGEWESHANTD